MMKFCDLRILLLSAMLLMGLAALAQGMPLGPAPAVEITAQPEELRIQPDVPARITIRISVPPGHHAYLDAGEDGGLIPISISLSTLEQAGFTAKRINAPKGDRDAEYRATVLRGIGLFVYELTARPGIDVRDGTYAITVRSQICNDASGACYFPSTDTLNLRVQVARPSSTSARPEATPRAAQTDDRTPTPSMPVTPGTTPSPAPTTAEEESDTIPVENQTSAPSAASAPPTTSSVKEFIDYTPRTDRKAYGLLIWLLMAFVAGLVLNVMPCVLPVMSIKVLSLVQQTGEDQRRAFRMGLVFAAGMLAVFLALAGAAIFFGLGWGEQFQSQAFLITIIGIIFAFALSLFGVYEFGVPRAVGSLAAHATSEGYGSTFLKGVLATLLATPCSGPFLGSTLAWTLTQPPAIVLLIFGMLGIGMALPYILLTAHPALLKFLPKPGAWMETFKHVMGFFLLATVVYLMVSLNQQLLLVTIVFLFCVSVAGWIWGRFSPALTPVRRLGVLVTVIVIIAGGAWLSFRTLHAALQPLRTETGESRAWEPYDQAKLLQYHRDGRSVFLDFTATWCANCQFNEINVYNSPQVRNLLREKDVVLMKADLTEEGPETAAIRQLMERLGARSIPFLAVFPGDNPTSPYTLHDLVSKKSVSDLIRQLPDAKRR